MTAPIEVDDPTGPDLEPSFTLARGADGGWRLAGEVDMAASALLPAMLVATCSDDWVVDVSGLEFADVAGMRAIATAAAEAQQPLTLRAASASFRRYWRLAGFGELAPCVRFTD